MRQRLRPVPLIDGGDLPVLQTAESYDCITLLLQRFPDWQKRFSELPD